jgi:hypothetical protein
MSQSFKEFLNEGVKLLKTQQGAIIRRSELGVGKTSGKFTYVHKNYESTIPDQRRLSKCKQAMMSKIGNVDYNVIKYNNDGRFTFFKSPDFDTAHEPKAGKYVLVDEDDNIKEGHAKAIWHHKWTMVGDDYEGFDCDGSYKRSYDWLKIPNIEFSEIHDPKIWDEKYVPKIGRI